ncbi:MAG: transporter [Pseudomonadales bacterium RIFCSPLOWO2_12_59_9]|nr:MAG: transporter [Pseudomonadales bacterium RIFCSPLOWO2_12_59_9]
MSEDSISVGAASAANSSRVARSQWSSRWVFFLAATGSAVGLGNVWKFPYITGENGGGAFVLVYLACILAIGIPLLMAEFMIGRRGQANPEGAVAALAREARASRHWRKLGTVAVLTGLLILSFYVVVAGWALAYVPTALMGKFSGLDGAASSAMFAALLADPWKLLGCTTLVLLITLGTVSLGVKEGLERSMRFMMPGLFILLLVLVGYAATTGYFGAALNFLFYPDFSKITGQGVLVALGHSFFTLSLGCGAMMVYGSYLPPGTSIAKTTLMVALTDTGVALLAGLAIFPLMFANNLEPSMGPGLVFVTLPIAFGQMPMGQLIGVLFFIMLFIAALTSAISLSEPAIAWLTEKFTVTRPKAALISGAVLWLLSIGSVLSFNAWSEMTLHGKTFFDCMDYLTANLLMPLGGLLTVLFSGWVLSRATVQQAIGIDHPQLFQLWWYLLRWLTPLGILVVFLHAIGLFD